LVTMTIMLVVLFALYSLVDTSMRVFSVGNDKVEAVENARLGLEKMKREIQAAYPYDVTDSATTNDYLFWDPAFPASAAMPSSSLITFGNDLNGNYRVDTPSEQITYDLNGTTLRRTLGAGSPQPVVGFIQDVDGDGNALTFTFCKVYDDGTDDTNDGCPTGYDAATSEGSISLVRIKLEVSVDRGIQEQPVTEILTTDVSLRNRGGQ
jgi:type II secretory pathway component PulJ